MRGIFGFLQTAIMKSEWKPASRDIAYQINVGAKGRGKAHTKCGKDEHKICIKQNIMGNCCGVNFLRSK